MQDLAALADPQWPVELLADPAIVRIGRDRIRFKVRSARAGYLYVLMMGSASPDLYLLFPNAIDAKNRLDAGATLQLPRQSWEMVAEGPPGVDRILAIVSPTPRDFTSAGLRPDGRFDLGLAAGVAAAQGRRALAGTPRDCAGPADGCERFGAARLEIRVVE